jgi:hypothetical protein
VEVVDAGGFSELLLEPVDPYQVSFSSGSDGLDGPFVRELVPGRWKTACVSGTQVETPVEGWAEFTVVDPGRVWTSTTLACDHRNWVTSSPVGTIPKADGETPEQAIARALSLPSTDVIEPAGFPNSVSPTYRVVRDGETVAWLWFEDWRRGDWRTSAVFTCEGAGIGFVNGQS